MHYCYVFGSLLWAVPLPPPRGGGVTKSQINQRTKYTGNCKYVLEEFKTISQYSVIATKYTPICTEIDYCINESSLIS